MNKRQTILSIAILIIIAACVVFILVKRPFSSVSDKAPAVELEFLNETEKAAFGLPSEARVQVIKRGEDGQAKVYKIIRQDSDLVADPDAVQFERNQE